MQYLEVVAPRPYVYTGRMLLLLLALAVLLIMCNKLYLHVILQDRMLLLLLALAVLRVVCNTL